MFRSGELPAANGADIFDYDPTERLPVIRINVGGTDVDVHVDSGSPYGITLPSKLANLKGAVKLGRSTFENPRIEVREAIPIGNVGFEFLRRFAVTVDRKNRRLRFTQ